MTIEAGPAHGVTRSASKGESQSAKGKKEASADAGSGGFMAAMAAVEAPTAAVQQVAVTPETVPAVKNDGSKTKVSGQAETGGGAGEAAVLVPDYTATVTDDPSLQSKSDSDVVPATDPAAVAAAAVLALFSVDPLAGSDMPIDAAALLGQSVAWNGGVVDGEQSLPGSTQALASGGIVATPRLATGPLAVAAPALGASETLGAQFADGLKQAGKGVIDTKAKSLAAAEPLGNMVSAPDSKSVAVNQRTVDLQMGPLMTTIAASTLVSMPQREDQPRERSVFRPTATEGSAAPLGATGASPTMTVSTAPEIIASTESLVAEKVSYWISNNVQNAEMKLDGIGDLPVEVSIRMQGNEAHVSFRTDELQTRAALENAGAHLKDLLQREGLVLSGVSVGTAGTGDSGAQERKSRQQARQSTVATLQPVRADAHSISGRVTRPGLDLFV